MVEPEPLGNREAQRAVIDPQHQRNSARRLISGSTRGPNISAKMIPVSMLIMSSRVTTATARARSTRADSSVWISVASPKITGTSSSRAMDKKRLSSSRLDHRHVVSGGDQIADDADPELAQPDDDDVVAQMAHPRAGGRE